MSAAEKKRFKSLMRMPAAETAPTAAPTPPQTSPACDMRGAKSVNPTLPATPAPSGRISLRTLYNDSDDAIHQKQWSIWLEEDKSLVPSYWYVVTEWGRVGWTLQQNRKKFPGKFSAEVEYDKVLTSKLRKGYHS